MNKEELQELVDFFKKHNREKEINNLIKHNYIEKVNYNENKVGIIFKNKNNGKRGSKIVLFK